MIEVTPISMTTVNWPVWQALTSKLLKRSVVAGLDRHNIPVQGLKAFVASLGEFKHANADVSATLRAAGNLLRHGAVSFLVAAPRELIFQLALDSNLSIVEADEPDVVMSLSVVSGTLEDWRNTLLNGCSPNTITSLRQLHNKLLNGLVALDLGQLFADYSRKSQPDETYILVEKK